MLLSKTRHSRDSTGAFARRPRGGQYRPVLDALKQQLRLSVEAGLDDDLVDRVDALKAELDGRETDDFGFDPEQLKLVLPVVGFFYRKYFRVETHGLRDLPEGRVLFICNHSGQVPIDAMMIATALILEGDPPRAVRSMIERWVPELPFVSTFFSRLGQVLGTPENCRYMLNRGYPVMVFPEGVRGISKTFDKAYELQEFGHGFMRLALETETPIVPVAVIGAEEQLPAYWNAKPLAKLLGIPAVPIIPTPLPLPTKYRIHFGRPLHFEGDPDDVDQVIGAKVAQVKEAIEGLLERGLAERKHVFW